MKFEVTKADGLQYVNVHPALDEAGDSTWNRFLDKFCDIEDAPVIFAAILGLLVLPFLL